MSRPVRLHVNIDHVATVRQARRAPDPSVEQAAIDCEKAGADGITVHLRTDRRHIQDADVRALRKLVTTHLNLEMAATDEMIAIALDVRPDTVTLVPESPDEITTEGGLDVVATRERTASTIRRLVDAGLDVSVFVEPEADQIGACAEMGAHQVELCTAVYATLFESGGHEDEIAIQIERHSEAARVAAALGLRVAAGHGLTYENVGAVVDIPEVEELNIGHNIVARSIFVGLEQAVAEMKGAITRLAL